MPSFGLKWQAELHTTWSVWEQKMCCCYFVGSVVWGQAYFSHPSSYFLQKWANAKQLVSSAFIPRQCRFLRHTYPSNVNLAHPDTNIFATHPCILYTERPSRLRKSGLVRQSWQKKSSHVDINHYRVPPGETAAVSPSCYTLCTTACLVFNFLKTTCEEFSHFVTGTTVFLNDFGDRLTEKIARQLITGRPWSIISLPRCHLVCLPRTTPL